MSSPIFAMNAPTVTTLVNVNVGLSNIADWETQTFDISLGPEGYEYLIIAVEYAGYNYLQGDYFALDSFVLTATEPALATFSATDFSALAARIALQNSPSSSRQSETNDQAPLLPLSSDVATHGLGQEQATSKAFTDYASSKFIFAEEKELPTQYSVLADLVFSDYSLDVTFSRS